MKLNLNLETAPYNSILLLFLIALLSACEASEVARQSLGANDTAGASEFVDYNSGVIFLLKGPPSSYANKLENVNSYEALYFVDKMRSDERRYISSDESLHTVFFVYNEVIPSESSVVTQHQFERPGRGKLQPFVFRHTFETGQDVRPLIVLNETRAGGRGGYLHYDLEINGQDIASKRVRIGR